jgi:hypothetical protein
MPPTTPHLLLPLRPPPIAPDVLLLKPQTPHAGHLLPFTPPAHTLPLSPPPLLSPPARRMTSPLPLKTPTPNHTARPSAAATLQPRGLVDGPVTYTPTAPHPRWVLKGTVLSTFSSHNFSFRRHPMATTTPQTSLPPRGSPRSLTGSTTSPACSLQLRSWCPARCQAALSALTRCPPSPLTCAGPT